jgi:pilus assembly protein CpaF
MKPRAFGRRQSQTQTPAEDIDDVLADSGEDVAAAPQPAPTAATEPEKNALTESELDSALNNAAAEVALANSQGTSEDTPEASGAADTASSAGQDTATEDADTDKADPALLTQVQSALLQRVDVSILARLPQSDLSREVGTMADEILNELNLSVDKAGRQSLVTALVSDITGENTAGAAAVKGHPKVAEPDLDVADSGMMSNVTRLKNGPNTPTPIEEAKGRIQTALMDRIDVAAASRLPRKELARQIANVVVEILGELKIQLNLIEQRDLVAMLLNDMLGLGPLEPLLADEAITDIMVNGPNQVYVERKGKLELTDVTFRNNAHLMNIATRIVSRIGRRIDESQPLVDARLEDGSRVNIIAPPLAIDGTSISIRKFAKQEITLDVMAKQNNLSANVSKVLKIAGRCGLNILISGGTGSGKTYRDHRGRGGVATPAAPRGAARDPAR